MVTADIAPISGESSEQPRWVGAGCGAGEVQAFAQQMMDAELPASLRPRRVAPDRALLAGIANKVANT